MGSKYVDHLIDDDEVPELTEEDAKNSLSFAELPADLQHVLSEIQRGNVIIRPDPVKKTVQLSLSSDVLAKFEAKGEGWESKVDEALREWLEEHKAS